MTLEEFLEENYNDVLVQYRQLQRKDELPKIGSEVESLVSGFGGDAGIVRTVIGYGYKGQESDGAIWGNDYIELSGGYLCEMENWWYKLKILSE